MHYLSRVFLPALRGAGLDASIELRRWGWHPAGGGEVGATIFPPAIAGLAAPPSAPITGFVASPLAPIEGLSAVSRLPRSIAERQRRRALERLEVGGLDTKIEIEEDDTAALGPGTVVFLAFPGRAGFAGRSSMGGGRLPAELAR